MTTIGKYANRINELIELADKSLTTKQKGSGTFAKSFVNSELFFEFKTSSLSFILKLYGENHPYYKEFNQIVTSANPFVTEKGREILKSLKSEIDGGWLSTLKGLVSAEIFSDFIEMADHLLKENYKDPAAVVIGSVLEEQLRLLCTSNGILVRDLKSGKPVAKKVDLLNSELAGAGVYNKLDQKNVTAWLDLRNKAAHGKYTEYNQLQVEHMLQAVTEFVNRINFQ